jgi:hypothetical protein
MVCKKCKSDGIKNVANNKEFYYCRTCKDEILLEQSTFEDPNWDSYLEMTKLSQKEVDDLFEQLTSGVQ